MEIIKKAKYDENGLIIEKKEVVDIESVIKELDIRIHEELKMSNFENACAIILQKNTLKNYYDVQNAKDKVYGFVIEKEE